jgi:superfamily I DNA/RNA helicase
MRKLRLLTGDSEILREARARCEHILLDEFQDIDEAQYEMVRLLAGSGPAAAAGIWAVGDPDQSIYGFRGASPEFIRRFQEDYAGTVLYPLVQSYRCTDIILRASEQVIRGSGLGIRVSGLGVRDSGIGIRKSGVDAFDSKPETRNSKLMGTGEGVKIQIIEHPTDASEAESVARMIEAMTGGLRFFSMDSGVTTGHDDSSLALPDFAVLCRIGRQMPAFEKAFHDHGIPYRKSDTEPFYRREPVRSVVAVLKKAVRSSGFGFRVSGSGLPNPDSVLNHDSHDRIVDGIGRETVYDLIVSILEAVPAAGAPEHRHEMEELLEMAEPFGRDADGFIRLLSLRTGLDGFRPELQAVALMTLHAAKGLEFSCVFIPGLEDGLLPYRLVERLEADTGEERRLLYVGMTRAKRTLILSHSRRRFLSGRELTLRRSPFLDAIEESLLEKVGPVFRGRRGGAAAGSQLEIF